MKEKSQDHVDSCGDHKIHPAFAFPGIKTHKQGNRRDDADENHEKAKVA